MNLAMEELHAAAFAYYSRSTTEIQTRIWDFFTSMDTDNDGRISYPEFTDFLQQSGYDKVIGHSNIFFTNLDRNRDNGLDFKELLTFYYIIKTRYIWCQGCHKHLCGLYFTCVACFDGYDHRHLRQINYHGTSTTFDLCADCYGQGNYTHHHDHFLDNHVLLRSKRGLPPYAQPDLRLAITPQNVVINNCQAIVPYNFVINHHYYPPAEPQRNRWSEAFRLLEIALCVASLPFNCAIM